MNTLIQGICLGFLTNHFKKFLPSVIDFDDSLFYYNCNFTIDTSLQKFPITNQYQCFDKPCFDYSNSYIKYIFLFIIYIIIIFPSIILTYTLLDKNDKCRFIGIYIGIYIYNLI